MSISNDIEFQQCCDIIEYLEEVDCRSLANLCISLCANIKEARDIVLGQYSEVLEYVD